MANKNLNRLVGGQATEPLRLEPPKLFPDSFLQRFPELIDHEAQELEKWKRNVAEIGRQIALAHPPAGR
jgi:spore cortex formation protein SpoVR/YcgB (stage V sporulation)